MNQNIVIKNDTQQELTKVLDEYKIDNKELRDYQKQALQNFINILFGYYCGILFFATGLGKSLIGTYMFIIHQFKFPNENVLWISHRNDIVDSIKKDFALIGKNVIYCTKSNIKETLEKNNGKLIVILRQNLTYDELHSILPYNTVHGIIHDECHDGTAKEKENNNTFFKFLKNIQITQPFLRYKIGLSATPLTNNSDQNTGMLEIYGKDGKINYLHTMTLFDGVDNKYLLEPKITMINYTGLKSLFELIKNDADLTEYNDNIDQLINKIIDIVKKKELCYKKGIVWFPSVKIVMCFYNKLKKEQYFKDNNIEIYFSTANKTQDDDTFLNRSSNCIMIACDKFKVGFNSVNNEFGINFNLSEQGYIFIQKLGRFTRLKDNQQYAYFFQFYESKQDIIELISQTLNQNFDFIKIHEKLDKLRSYKEITEIDEFKDIKRLIDCIVIEGETEQINYDDIKKKYINDNMKIMNKIDLNHTVFLEELNKINDFVYNNPENPDNKFPSASKKKENVTKNKTDGKDKKKGTQIKVLDNEPEITNLCDKFRNKKKDGKLSQIHINLLNDIVGWYWTEDIKNKKDTYVSIKDKIKEINTDNADIKNLIDTISDIADSMCSGNVFSDKIRNQKGTELKECFNNDTCKKFENKVLNGILCRKYAVNPQEQNKIMFYLLQMTEKIHQDYKIKELEPEEIKDNDPKEIEEDNNPEIIDDITEEDLKEEENYDDFDTAIDTKNSKNLHRKGQEKYRTGLIDKYGKKCMITGYNIALQACHIKPYSVCKKESKNEMYDINNGLILKSDIHCAFDNGYIGINPVTLRLEVKEDVLKDNSYFKEFQGMEITKIKGNNKMTKYLEYHYNNIYKKIEES